MITQKESEGKMETCAEDLKCQMREGKKQKKKVKASHKESRKMSITEKTSEGEKREHVTKSVPYRTIIEEGDGKVKPIYPSNLSLHSELLILQSYIHSPFYSSFLPIPPSSQVSIHQSEQGTGRLDFDFDLFC